jgi:hypothetical protein
VFDRHNYYSSSSGTAAIRRWMCWWLGAKRQRGNNNNNILLILYYYIVEDFIYISPLHCDLTQLRRRHAASLLIYYNIVPTMSLQQNNNCIIMSARHPIDVFIKFWVCSSVSARHRPSKVTTTIIATYTSSFSTKERPWNRWF